MLVKQNPYLASFTLFFIFTLCIVQIEGENDLQHCSATLIKLIVLPFMPSVEIKSIMLNVLKLTVIMLRVVAFQKAWPGTG
jgi:hypothetical protein